MEPQAARFIPRLSAAAVALLAVFCGAWFMAAMGWVPAIFDGGGEVATWRGREEAAMPVPAPDTGAFSNRSACGRCGVIESVRQAKKTRNPPGIASLSGGKGGEVMAVLQVLLNAMAGITAGGPIRPVPSYEITVRFHDGSMRILTETGTPAWKPGNPVKVINGRIRPDA